MKGPKRCISSVACVSSTAYLTVMTPFTAARRRESLPLSLEPPSLGLLVSSLLSPASAPAPGSAFSVLRMSRRTSLGRAAADAQSDYTNRHHHESSAEDALAGARVRVAART